MHDLAATRLWAKLAGMKSKTVNLALPEIALIAVTRAALGIGIGLLLSTKMKRRARGAAGVALLGVGVVTTLPLVWHVRARLT